MWKELVIKDRVALLKGQIWLTKFKAGNLATNLRGLYSAHGAGEDQGSLHKPEIGDYKRLAFGLWYSV